MEPKHFEPGLYPNTVDIDVAMNNLIENVLVYKNMDIAEVMYQ